MAKKADQEVIVDEVSDSEPRVYELGFHLDPELPTEEVKKQYQAVRAAIEAQGSVVAEVMPEKIALAYTISRQEVSGRRDFSSAYFAWIVYEVTPEAHAAVTAMADGNPAIIRFIDLATTKEAARYALEAHELAAQAAADAATEGDGEETLNTELDAALEHAAV